MRENRSRLPRRKTRAVMKGNVRVGGGADISVQSMLKIPTKNVEECIRQIEELADFGCDIIRIAVQKEADAKAAGEIANAAEMPVVADIHLRAKLAMAALEAGVDAIRVNPGNIRKERDLEDITACAKNYGAAIRIGVNSGSVRRRGKSPAASADRERPIPELLVELLTEHVRLFEKHGFENLVLSAKCSDPVETIHVYRKIADTFDYPLHVGVTAAGPPPEGIIRNCLGIGTLLAEGIGDTIRVSLTGPSSEEVMAGREILRSLGLGGGGVVVIACPTCGRTSADIRPITILLRDAVRKIDKCLVVGVMGCEVNGPGEAVECDVALVIGAGKGILYVGGEKRETGIAPKDFLNVLLEEIEKV